MWCQSCSPIRWSGETFDSELTWGRPGTQGCWNMGVRAVSEALMAVSQGCWPQRELTTASWKIDLRIPLPSTHTHTSPNTTSIFGPICFPVPHSSPQHSQTHTTHSLNPIVNIISFSDRWEGSDLMENEATNLHPYYTVIHTQLQTCMCKLALSCTMLPRMTLTVTHLLNWYVKEEGDGKSVCQK